MPHTVTVEGSDVTDVYDSEDQARARAREWALRGILATVDKVSARKADAIAANAPDGPVEEPANPPLIPEATPTPVAPSAEQAELDALRAENARLRAEAAAMAADGAPTEAAPSGEAPGPATSNGSGQ